MIEATTRALQLADKIKPLLAGQGPDVQGAALVELLSEFLLGHVPALREEVLKMHVEAVRSLVEAAHRCGADPWRTQ